MTGAVRLGRAYVNLLANLMMASFMPGCPMAEAFAMVIALLDWRHQVLVYRELRLAGLPAVFVRTADTAGAVLYLVAAAQVLTFGNLPAQSAFCVQDMAAMPLMLLILLNFLLLLLGTVLEPLPAIILTAPVLLLIATNVCGIDPLAFGVILCANLALGLLLQPVYAGLFTTSLLTGLRPNACPGY